MLSKQEYNELRKIIDKRSLTPGPESSPPVEVMKKGLFIVDGFRKDVKINRDTEKPNMIKHTQ